MVKDSTDFLIELRKMEVEETYRSFNLVGTLDVYTLYQSIHLDLAVEALTDALITVTDSFL